MSTRLYLGSEAQAALRTLHPQAKKSIRDSLRKLKERWPTPTGLDVTRLRSDPSTLPVFRLRVGDWRIVFRARGENLEVVRVFHRREGYGWMERS